MLAAAKDALGWHPPYHEHWKTFQPETGPPSIANCSAAECEAPGCPRTESGFPPAGGVGSSVGLRETIETQVRVSNPEHWRLDDVELTDAAIGHAVRRIVEREAAERNDG